MVQELKGLTILGNMSSFLASLLCLKIIEDEDVKYQPDL